MDQKEGNSAQLLTAKGEIEGEDLYRIDNEWNEIEVYISKDELGEEDNNIGKDRKGLENEGDGVTLLEEGEDKMDMDGMQSKKEGHENQKNGKLIGENGEERVENKGGEGKEEKEEEDEEGGGRGEEDEERGKGGRVLEIAKGKEEEKEKELKDDIKEEVYTIEDEKEEGGEGRRGTDSSILIPEWLFEQPNVRQDDATRGASGSSSSEDKMESPRCRCCPSWHPWFFIGLGWLPILVGIFLSLSIVIPYCIAVGLKHVSPGFPYISDSGTVPPESCIFGQLLNMAAGLGLAGIYVRYKQVILYSDDYDSRRGRMLQINKISLVLGIIACFGMSVVANFQVGNVMPVHFSGAFLLFAPGAVYGFLQAWLSYKMYPRHASIHVCHIRLILSVIIAIFFTLCTIFTLIAQELTHQTGSILHWAPEDGGYREHIVATVSEWVVAIAFLLYYFTFIREFQTITIKAELKHHLVYDALVEANSYPPVANYDNSFSGAL